MATHQTTDSKSKPDTNTNTNTTIPTLTSVTSLPPPTRHITTHDPKTGKSILYTPSPPLLYHDFGGAGGAARSYSTPIDPPTLHADADLTDYLATGYADQAIVGAGSKLHVVELGPGQATDMHRTVSIDYVVVTNGRVEMWMDGGACVGLRPGDHVVQRGTMHRWVNPSETEPARVLAVTLPCEPFVIPGTGQMLEEVHVPGSEKKDWHVGMM